MIREAIVLAGGLGTRLREAVPDLPKCMAPVAGKPFLEYLLKVYRQKGIDRFILSLGYKSEIIIDYCTTELPGFDLKYVVESEPMGTGGAIMLCMNQTTNDDILILNGDTYFDADLRKLFLDYKAQQVECTLALKPMQNFDRYGAVEIDSNNIIQSFFEKRHIEEGLINAGVYVLNNKAFIDHRFSKKFSFEKEYLEEYCAQQIISASIQDKYFIDIGIPADYQRAQTEIPQQINN